MKSARHIISLLLLLSWLPCTVHCQIESLGLFGSAADCCERGETDAGGQGDCQQCNVCQSVETGGYFFVKDSLLLPVVFDFVATVLNDETADPDRFRPAHAADANTRPRFLATSWQFHLRASSPPRAPSLFA
ncbi:hypothetical protein LBMAG56_54190 [Verrucomicrobiota bacterium]|nr:hypothetical protein LBMAG56_54190 [Verrucomicrobiota bacterium]